MKIIMKTQIENLLQQSRRLNWAGNKSVYLPGKGTVVVDGAYPTACKNPRFAKQLESEIAQGWIKLTIITNLETKAAGAEKASKPPVQKTPKSPAKKPAEAGKVDQDTVGGTAKQVTDAPTGIVKLDADDPMPSPDTIVMAGVDVKEPPGTKSMFAPDAKLNEVVGQEIEVPAEDTPAEEAAEGKAEDLGSTEGDGDTTDTTEAPEPDAPDEAPEEPADAPEEQDAPAEGPQDDLETLNRKDLVKRAKSHGIKGSGTSEALIKSIREKIAAE
jgi:hypothetical protein